MRQLRLVAHQARYDVRIWWRDPAALFFTVILPVLFLLLIVAIFGNQTLDGRGIKASTYYVPALVALAVISATFVNLVITLPQQRESGLLKRVRGTPLPVRVFIAGQVVTAVCVSVVTTAVLIVIGWALFGVDVPTTTLAGFIVTLVVGAAAFSCVGIALGGAVPTEAAGPAVANAIALPLYFISGIFVPSEQVPAWLRQVADVFPVKPFAEALLEAFAPRSAGGLGVAVVDLAVVVAWGLVGLLVAVRTFRWAPRQS